MINHAGNSTMGAEWIGVQQWIVLIDQTIQNFE